MIVLWNPDGFKKQNGLSFTWQKPHGAVAGAVLLSRDFLRIYGGLYDANFPPFREQRNASSFQNAAKSPLTGHTESGRFLKSRCEVLRSCALRILDNGSAACRRSGLQQASFSSAPSSCMRKTHVFPGWNVKPSMALPPVRKQMSEISASRDAQFSALP